MSESVRNSPHMADLDACLEEWVDERIVSREDVKTWYLFHVMMVNLGDAGGWHYDGHSLKIGSPMCLLIVRATIDGIPHVAFSSNRTTTGCMRAFLRKESEGWLEWSKDRFR